MNDELADRLVRAEIASATTRGAFGGRLRLRHYRRPEIWLEADSVKRERTFLIRVRVDDYDAQPPQIRVVYEDGSDVASSDHPIGGGGPLPAHARAGLSHFLCIDGTRDYYEHDSHLPQQTGVSWERQRGERSLSSLLLTIADKFASGAWS